MTRSELDRLLTRRRLLKGALGGVCANTAGALGLPLTGLRLDGAELGLDALVSPHPAEGDGATRWRWTPETCLLPLPPGHQQPGLWLEASGLRRSPSDLAAVCLVQGLASRRSHWSR